MGSRKSSSNATSSNSSTDNRQVNDAGGGIAGAGNWWDQSISDNRTTTDSGNTVWTQTTNANDNRTTTDSGNTTWDWRQDSTTTDSGNTTWNWSTTDGGAIKGMTDVALGQADLAAQIAQISSGNASKAIDAAVRSQENALSTAGDALDRAISAVQSAGAQAYKSSADGLGMVYQGFDKLASLTGSLVSSAQKQADNAATSVQAAYTTAASQANGNKTLTIAALAAVGLIGVAALVMRRRAA